MEDMSRGIEVVKLLKQIMVIIKHSNSQPCGKMNLTGPQGMLIGILAHLGAMKISDLSEKMGLSNSTVSGIVDRLEKQGIVERTRSKEDRRVVQVNVTEEFKADAKSRFEIIERRLEAIMGEATEEEMNKVLEGLEILKELIDKSI
jgi:DNA-binding MarR family transcriptional regulator